MKTLILLLILVVLVGCQATGGGSGGIVANHIPQESKFTVSTTLNKIYTSAESLDIRLTFPSSVTVTGTPSINITIGSNTRVANYVSGTGSSSLIFRYAIVPGDNDSDGISIATSVALNGGTLTYSKSDGTILNCPTTLTPPATASVRVDTSIPVITTVTAPVNGTYYYNMPLLFNVAFSENVTVTGSPRLAIDIGGSTRYATYISGSNSSTLVFQYSVTGTDVDSDGITIQSPILLNGGSIKDAVNPATLTLTAPDTSGVIIAGANPIITFVTPPANATYITGQNLDFTLLFNKVVNITGSPRLSLTVGSTTRYASYISGSGTNSLRFRYTVTGGDSDSDGISAQNIIDMNGGTIADSSSNQAIPAFIVPVLTGVRIANTVPLSILAVTIPSSPPSYGYDAGQDIDFTVTFSEAVTEAGGTSRLRMDIGGVTRYATYFSGSGSANLIYRYTVVANEEDLNGLTLFSPFETNSATITNAVGQTPALTFSVPVTTSLLVDAKSPAIISNSKPLDGTYSNTQNLDFDVTFDEPVVVTGSPRLVLDIGGTPRYATYLSGSLTPVLRFRYTVGATDNDADGIALNANIDLNSGSIRDPNNHNASLTLVTTTTSGIRVDNAAPVIASITPPADGSYGNGDVLTFVATFSEIVSVTGAPKLAFTLGSTTKYANYVSGTGTSALTFSYLVMNGDSDPDGIALTSPMDLNGGTIRDGVNLNAVLTFTPPVTTGVIVSASNPVITSITLPANGRYTTGQNVDFSVVFSEPVFVTPPPRISITLTSGTVYADYLSGGGSDTLVFRYTVASGDVDQDGIVIASPIDLNGGAIQNITFSLDANVTFTLPNTSGIVIDGLDPVISSVTPPADKIYILGENLNFVVNYSSNVVVTGSPRLNFTIGTTPVAATYLSGSGTNALTFRYTVVANDLDSDGITLASPLSLNSGKIKDIFGDDAGLVFTPPVTSGVQIDAVVPTISSVTGPSAGTYYEGDFLNFTVNFSENVVITGSPRIVLTIGSNTRFATYVSGTGTNSAIFRYTVANGDTDSDGIASSSPLALNSGTLRDVAGNNLSPLTFTVPDTSGVILDANNASILSITAPADGAYKTTNAVSFIANFSRAVSVAGTPRIALTVGSSTVYANYASGSGTTAITFTYTVASGHSDSNGLEMISPVALNGGEIKDSTNNNAGLAFTSPVTSGILIDGLDPVISSVTPPSNKTYIIAENIDFVVNYTAPVVVTGVPSLSLTIGSSSVAANYQSGSGTTALTFRYTVVAGNSDTDGIAIASPVALNGGTIRDEFNDNASLTFTLPTTSGINVDGIVPTILAVSPPSAGTYYLGETMDFDVSFSDSVVVTGSPAVSLTIGAASRLATYVSGSGTNTLRFRYTIVVGDTDTDGISVVSPLDLNSGTIRDVAGNNATLTFTQPDASGVKVDTSSVEITSVTVAPGKYNTGAFLDINVTYERAVTVTNTPQLRLTIGASTVFANYVSGSGTDTLIFRYTVVAGNVDSDGIVLVPPVLLNGGAIQDSSNQNATLTYTAPNTSTVLVDGIDLEISSITVPADKTYILNEDMFFDVTYNYPATVTGNPRIGLTVGSSLVHATYVSGTGTNVLRFRYTVASSDLDIDGVTSASPIDLNSGTIRDSFGDNASLSFTAGNYPGVKADGVVPTIASLTPPSNATYDAGQSLSFTVNFSEDVTINGTPRIALTIGSTTRYATYQSGSGSNAAVFSYTLVGADTDSDGIAVTSPLDLNSGTITDIAGNNLSALTFTAPNTSGVLVAGNVADAAYSTITGTGPVLADGTATSTITITLKNSVNNPVAGVVPAFSATDTGTTNVYGTCSSTDTSGVSTCTLRSTRAETKTLSITSPVTKADGTVVFTAGAPVAANSTITGTGPVIADGTATSTVTITLRDANNNGVSGIVPTFTATNTGTTNVYGTCSSTTSAGVSTCTLRSTRAETKTLSIATPIARVGGTVVFTAGSAVVANSYITGTTPVSADGISTSFIEISLRDFYNNPVQGVTPIYNATDTGTTNVYGACSATSAAGISACTLASTTAEFKTLQLTSPIAVTGNAVEFSSSLPTSQNSSIVYSGTGSVVADGVAFANVTITLRDANNNLVTLGNGALPDFVATDTGTTNAYSECVNSSTGVYTCTFSSRKSETKTLSITSPINKNDGTVVFVAGPAAASFSTIAGTGPTVADNIAASTITVTIKDQYNNSVAGTVPTFSATNTGNTNVMSACTSTDATGVSTCTLRSTVAETKTLSIVTPVAKSGGTVVFIGGTPVAANSTITGTGPVSPDGVAKSTVTITLRDVYNNTSPGVTPTFTATGTNNIYGACSASTSTGISTCTLASTTAEVKTLSIATPFVKSGGTVEFIVGAPVAENSTITGTEPVVANGTSTSTITITLRDSSNSPSPGITPTFTATGTNNTYGACTVTNASGVSTCTLASTTAEDKVLSITSPFTKEDAAVTFIAGPAVLANSTISASDGTIADGVDTCEITVTLKDAYNNEVEGVVPTYSMTGILNTLGACTPTDAAGISTCLVTSTKPEGKQVSLVTPFAKAGNTVDFNPYGINIQVPIEMTDVGLASNTGAITFNRTRTSLNTSDYVSQSNEYSFEIVATNTNTTSSYTVSLVNSAGANITDSIIQIPANTLNPTRFRVVFTPTSGSNNYRVRINASAVANQVIVHSAKMIVSQYRATASKIYIPLTQGNFNSPSNLDTNAAAIASFTTSAYVALTAGTASYWNKVPANYDAILTTATDAFTLEAVLSSTATNRTSSVGLFNRTLATPAVVTGAEAAFAGTTITMIQKTFANNAVNFTDNNQFELRGKNSHNNGTSYLYKAGLWVKLNYLKRAEIYHRLALRRSTVSTSSAMTHGRFLWESSEWSNPSVFLEINGSGATSSAYLVDNGASDSSQSGTSVSGSTQTSGAAYARQRSGALNLTNLNSYTLQHNVSSGTPTLGSGFLVIQAHD